MSRAAPLLLLVLGACAGLGGAVALDHNKVAACVQHLRQLGAEPDLGTLTMSAGAPGDYGSDASWLRIAWLLRSQLGVRQIAYTCEFSGGLLLGTAEEGVTL